MKIRINPRTFEGFCVVGNSRLIEYCNFLFSNGTFFGTDHSTFSHSRNHFETAISLLSCSNFDAYPCIGERHHKTFNN